MPLRLRLAVLFAIGTGVVLVAAAVLFYVQLNSSLRSTLDSSLQLRADALSAELRTSGLTSYETGSARDRDDTSGVRSQVLGTDGTVLGGGPAILDGVHLTRALTGQITFTGTASGQRVRVLAEPAQAGATHVVLVVAANTDVIDTAADRVRNVMVFSTAPAIALAGIAAWILSGAALRPVERMRRQAADISEHDTGARLAVPTTRDEIAALATTMNGMLTRLQTALARERGFVADAGHELRTPLTILKAELELAGRPGRTREQLAEAVGLAAEETDRLIRLSEALLLLARSDDGDDFLAHRPVDLHAVLAAATRAAGTLRPAVVVRLEVTGRPSVLGDADRLRQAVDNLLANAVRYAPDGTTVDVTAGQTEPGGPVVIEVADRGPGFPPDFLPDAFTRFRRADTSRSRAGGGAGLGLAIVQAIAHAHKGTAVAANRPDGGGSVRLELPADPTHSPLPVVSHVRHTGAIR